ncbi:hypothetical protein R6242_18400 [Iodobacter sp. CM08]|uniref:hypothetical protein n=1 Tax=Iodobacter sp. CM08 TaxID=3085902 RepID=UPI002982217D|nr:hypothetical protein [Iodobacter sp. CM08]MDW5418539.1 hypothetical protein [Iodobacter sp. CM08]
MNTSDNSNKTLKQWLGFNTWHTNHDLDMNRFYEFVNAYIIDNGLLINDESVLAETIANQVDIKTTDPRFETIKEKVTLMYSIIDFLKVTGRK